MRRPAPDDPRQDPVEVSVAAYGTDPAGYERRYAAHRLDRPARFAALLPPSARILDLGCGPGRDLRIFSTAGHRPVGIERQPAFVAMARRHGEVIEADLRDAAGLFPPSTFDGVWAQASLVHLPPADVEQVLRDVRTLLVPGGGFYACVPATGTSGWRTEADGRRWYTVWAGRRFVDAVVAAGLDVVEVVDGVYVEVVARRPPNGDPTGDT